MTSNDRPAHGYDFAEIMFHYEYQYRPCFESLPADKQARVRAPCQSYECIIKPDASDRVCVVTCSHAINGGPARCCYAKCKATIKAQEAPHAD